MEKKQKPERRREVYNTRRPEKTSQIKMAFEKSFLENEGERGGTIWGNRFQKEQKMHRP